MSHGRDEMKISSEMNGLNEIDSRVWYVIQTKPGNEHRVVINLSHQGIETFLPLFKSYRSCHGRLIQNIKPLFPNYLFTNLFLQLHYYKVKWTRGVNKILGTENGPAPISEKVIQAIKERLGSDNLVKLDEGLKEGEVIQITSGPFKGLTGIFQSKISDRGRVRILLSLIGIDVSVQISQWQIKKVS